MKPAIARVNAAARNADMGPCGPMPSGLRTSSAEDRLPQFSGRAAAYGRVYQLNMPPAPNANLPSPAVPALTRSFTLSDARRMNAADTALRPA